MLFYLPLIEVCLAKILLTLSKVIEEKSLGARASTPPPPNQEGLMAVFVLSTYDDDYNSNNNNDNDDDDDDDDVYTGIHKPIYRSYCGPCY